MNNEELMEAIRLTFQQCVDSYKFGSSYAGTDMYKDSLAAMKMLLRVLVQRAEGVGS